MKKHMIWGLAILMLLIGIAGVFLLIPRDTDTESEMVLGDATKKLLEDGPKPKGSPQEVNTPEPGVRPPPPGETKETGYWHGDHWHSRKPNDGQTPREQPLNETELSKYWDGSIGSNGEPIPVNSKQRADLRRIRRYLSLGIEPPPKGYDYLLIDDKEIVLDNGAPFLINMEADSTQYWITTHTGFAPTLQQYERYQELQRKLKEAKRDNDMNLIQQLSAEIDSLTADAQGKLPSFSTFGKADPSEYGTEAFEHSLAEKRKPILRAAYRHMGLEHLLRPEPRTIIIDGQELEIVED